MWTVTTALCRVVSNALNFQLKGLDCFHVSLCSSRKTFTQEQRISAQRRALPTSPPASPNAHSCLPLGKMPALIATSSQTPKRGM